MTKFFVNFHRYHSSECNSSYIETTSTRESIRKLLTKGFTDGVMCAGSDLGMEGSCKGDSGGPLMTFDRRLQQCTVEQIHLEQREYELQPNLTTLSRIMASIQI